MSPKYDVLIFLGTVIVGLGIELILSKIYFSYRGGRKKHQVVRFKFVRYLFLISIPMLAVAAVSISVSPSVLRYFLEFAILGTALEYCVGYSYKTIVGQRLWVYNKYSIAGHTSLLSIPLWGLCGTLMFLLSRTI